MERLKLRFAENRQTFACFGNAGLRFGGELLMDITKYLKKYRYYVFI